MQRFEIGSPIVSFVEFSVKASAVAAGRRTRGVVHETREGGVVVGGCCLGTLRGDSTTLIYNNNSMLAERGRACVRDYFVLERRLWGVLTGGLGGSVLTEAPT